MAFVKLTKLNEQGDEQGFIYLNPEHVVGVEEPHPGGPSVRVQTLVSIYRVKQAKDEPSVREQLEGLVTA